MVSKVIFLDVDGVLNYAAFDKYTPEGYQGVDPEKVKLLRKIVEATGASIVLSSSWKMGWNGETGLHDTDVEYLNRMLAEEGLKIIDKTPGTVSWGRGAEIQKWVKMHPELESWAVLDDCIFEDFKACDIMPRLVKTNYGRHGLEEKHVRKCIEILNKEREQHK